MKRLPALAIGSGVHGVITTRDVLLHPVLIIGVWGPRAYVRCLKAMLARRPTTFLEVVYAARR